MKTARQIADLVLGCAVADLAKIEAAACYVKGVNLVRRQLIFLALRFLFLFVGAFAIVALPLAVVACMPWAPAVKLFGVFLLGTVYLSVPAIILWRSLSQERWMEFSQADRFVEQAIKKN
ncbi:MAG: hypothetical protein ACREH5_05560 [Candidatus Omnitrophota bacterium]